jgi:hypothetical protein
LSKSPPPEVFSRDRQKFLQVFLTTLVYIMRPLVAECATCFRFGKTRIRWSQHRPGYTPIEGTKLSNFTNVLHLFGVMLFGPLTDHLIHGQCPRHITLEREYSPRLLFYFIFFMSNARTHLLPALSPSTRRDKGHNHYPLTGATEQSKWVHYIRYIVSRWK